jgi:hypothetical protein
VPELETSYRPSTDTALQDAINAEHAEKNMSFWTAVKTYRKAVIWSMAISATLVMEGYDTSCKSHTLVDVDIAIVG